MDNCCVMCGRELPTEHDSMVCPQCIRDVTIPKTAHSIIEIPPNNIELSFNGGNGLEMDFIVGYRRAKPLNWFQRWMFKACFGIRARNMGDFE